mmetsp:Transcript_6338/g.22586  ORF Transcript_6338/g.22586 Transcript_6338/m.22586 type:complete len:131 (+) Transcript_6338:877-1269(+)
MEQNRHRRSWMEVEPIDLSFRFLAPPSRSRAPHCSVSSSPPRPDSLCDVDADKLNDLHESAAANAKVPSSSCHRVSARLTPQVQGEEGRESQREKERSATTGDVDLSAMDQSRESASYSFEFEGDSKIED